MVNSPDAKSISLEVIEYWKARSKQTPYPVLQARYADLALDIGCIWNHEHPDKAKITLPRELSQCAIDGYICTVEGCLSTENYQTWTFLNRAIDLALLVKDTQRVEKIKHIALAYTRNQPKSWWELNSLVWEKKRFNFKRARA
ncbi:hypothetical protein [Polynucleobacter sp. P1-05-14]|uniref:hypothetical protein n=1 Tax=Polynucleobacter sp. P1-05-14 TaxID=1819732 RepID=UPI001C0AFE12|nr:hypothetical protein [Polynucleobacter sp. P1-05-14]MBU3548270.1 hypothetical protein [Polynucleobacter sp. P1-05-14]